MATYRNTRFVLGMAQGGKEYVFTDLPSFRTRTAIAEYLKEHPQPGPLAIWRERDAYAHGVNYGKSSERVPLED